MYDECWIYFGIDRGSLLSWTPAACPGTPPCHYRLPADGLSVFSLAFGGIGAWLFDTAHNKRAGFLHCNCNSLPFRDNFSRKFLRYEPANSLGRPLVNQGQTLARALEPRSVTGKKADRQQYLLKSSM